MPHIFYWIQLVLLTAAAPFFVFPRSGYWPVFFLVPVLFLAGWVVKKQAVEATPLDLPMVVLMAAVFVSALRVTDVEHGLPKLAGVLYAVAFFYVLAGFLRTERIIRWAVPLFLITGVGFAVIGVLGMPTFKGKHLHFLQMVKERLPQIQFGLPGAESGFSTNAVGGVLLLFIPLFFTMSVAVGKRKRALFWRVLLGLGALFVCFALLLTQSRGSWAALLLASIGVGMLLLFRIVKRKKLIAAVLMVLLVVGVGAGIGSAVYAMNHSDQLAQGMKQAEGTLLFRVQLWDFTLPVIAANPVFGIGLNNFRMLPEVRYFLSHPHNQFLYVAVELGVPALTAYLAILFLTAYMCMETWRKQENQQESQQENQKENQQEDQAEAHLLRYASLGLGWGQLAFLLFGLTDAIPLGSKVGIFFWVSLALITSMYLYRRRCFCGEPSK